MISAIFLLILVQFAFRCDSQQALLLSEVKKIAESGILQAFEANKIPQKSLSSPGETKLFSRESICGHLVSHHNQLVKGANMTFSNADFLSLEGVWNRRAGFHILTEKFCTKGLWEPIVPSDPYWLDHWVGFHKGFIYSKNEQPSTLLVQQNAMMRNLNHRDSVGIQSVIVESNCEAERNGMCPVGWNYVDSDREKTLPNAYQYFPQTKLETSEEVSIGFLMRFERFGIPDAECVLWINTIDSNLNCLNFKQKPHRGTVAGYQGVSQFLIFDTPDESGI